MKPSLNNRIAQFYDRSTEVWLTMWGEHMHHGYYPEDKPNLNHQQAQVELMERALNWGCPLPPTRILDAGCGVGGSARYLAQKYGAQVLGVNLSGVQVEYARKLTQDNGLSGQIVFRQQDLMTLQPTDGPFDLIWSMENAEHIADKTEMIKLFYDLLAPGGRLLLITWCTRDLAERPLRSTEHNLLKKLCAWYHLPPWISLGQYRQISQEIGFANIQTADWSEQVAPFWGAVIRSALSMRGVRGLLRSGVSTLRGAWAMQYMQRGYRSGLIRFGLLQAQKP